MPLIGRFPEPARRRTRGTRLTVAALGCLVVVGCAGESTTATPAASGPASTAAATYSVQLCSEAALYQTAANDMAVVDVTTAGTDGVKKALLNLQTAANNLVAVAAAENQFGPQVAELEAASTSLNTTIEDVANQDDASLNGDTITASVSAVEQAAKPMVDSLRGGCPSVPPAVTPPS